MKLKVPGAIWSLGCPFLSTGAKNVWGVVATPLRRTRVKEGWNRQKIRASLKTLYWDHFGLTFYQHRWTFIVLLHLNNCVLTKGWFVLFCFCLFVICDVRYKQLKAVFYNNSTGFLKSFPFWNSSFHFTICITDHNFLPVWKFDWAMQNVKQTLL